MEAKQGLEFVHAQSEEFIGDGVYGVHRGMCPLLRINHYSLAGRNCSAYVLGQLETFVLALHFAIS